MIKEQILYIFDTQGKKSSYEPSNHNIIHIFLNDWIWKEIIYTYMGFHYL